MAKTSRWSWTTPEPGCTNMAGGRSWLLTSALPPQLTLVANRAELTAFGRRDPGPRELGREYGLARCWPPRSGRSSATPAGSGASRHGVRHAGLDISVYDSDGKHKGRPRLTRQGPPALRWALYEGAVHAHKQTSPDHAYYTRLAGRIGPGRARLAVARKPARRCHHRLRALGDQAWIELSG